MEAPFSLHGSVPLMALVLMTNLVIVHGIGNSSVRTSTLQLINAANSTNTTNVNKIYGRTDSAQHCGLRCANLLSPSFHYDNQTSTCYCNSRYDPDIVQDSGPGGIVYGYVTSDDTIRSGTPSECQDVYDKGYRGEVVFQLSPGEMITCDLASLGWVVFQRRLDGSVGFHRNWTEYVHGFGDQNGEFWLGLETIHQLTTTTGCELQIYLEAEPHVTAQDNGYARYSTFSVLGTGTNYTLNVGGFSGNMGDSFSYHSGMQFSTYDVENDRAAINCAQRYMSGWWFGACHRSNLNGLYLAGNHSSYADGVDWLDPWGYHYSLLRTEMAFRC